MCEWEESNDEQSSLEENEIDKSYLLIFTILKDGTNVRNIKRISNKKYIFICKKFFLKLNFEKF